MAICHRPAKKRVDSLNEPFNIFLTPAPLELLPTAQPSAPLLALHPAPSELPSEPPYPLLVPAPVSATPSPSVETVEEVEYPLRGRQMRKKLRAL